MFSVFLFIVIFIVVAAPLMMMYDIAHKPYDKIIAHILTLFAIIHISVYVYCVYTYLTTNYEPQYTQIVDKTLVENSYVCYYKERDKYINLNQELGININEDDVIELDHFDAKIILFYPFEPPTYKLRIKE